jgi:TatD DNase family protein
VEEGLPEELLGLARDSRTAAIGETGLDYYYDHSPRHVQQEIFLRHLEWASEANKPLVIHVRDAMPDTLKLLEKASPDPSKTPLVFHCYSGGLEYLSAMRELGAYLSLGGPVTWPKNGALREVAARIPEDRLLCETDSPWLTPKPYRGKLNEPAYLLFVYDEIAISRGLSLERLARIVVENAARLFGWGILHKPSKEITKEISKEVSKEVSGDTGPCSSSKYSPAAVRPAPGPGNLRHPMGW